MDSKILGFKTLNIKYLIGKSYLFSNYNLFTNSIL